VNEGQVDQSLHVLFHHVGNSLINIVGREAILFTSLAGHMHAVGIAQIMQT
jgi:hypothetical protein